MAKTKMEQLVLTVKAQDHAMQELREQVAALTSALKKSPKTKSRQGTMPPVEGVDAAVLENVKRFRASTWKKYGNDVLAVEASTHEKVNGDTIPVAKVALSNNTVFVVSAYRFWRIE